MNENKSITTYYGVKCPKCGSDNYYIKAQKGSTGNLLISQAGALNAGAFIRGSFKTLEKMPLITKCKDCKNKFELLPINAEDEELLSQPAFLKITRKKAVVGCVVNYFVLLNGEIVAPIKNGETIEVETNVKHNYIQLFDYNGAGATYQKVIVTPGETLDILLTRKLAK